MKLKGKTRIRVFTIAFMAFPIVFLFGLEGYLLRYEQHSKYLSQLKDDLIEGKIKMEKKSEIDNVNFIIENIEDGDFSNVARCLRADKVWGGCGELESFNTNTATNSNIELIDELYKDMASDDIAYFRGTIPEKKIKLDQVKDFDLEYDFISDNDIEAWLKFNTTTRYRYGYFIDLGRESPRANIELIRAGGSYEPFLSYSNTTDTDVGRVRILAISDSFGDGGGLLSSDDSWSRELEFQLNQIEDNYEVVSLARGGAGYLRYLNWVEDGYVEAIDPDIVLLSYVDNDFNFIDSFGLSKGNSLDLTRDDNYLDPDNELAFYLRCFEEEDDFFGRGLKKVNKFLPSIYRFYKFSNCSEDYSSYSKKDLSNGLSNGLEIIDTYKKMDSLIKVPFYLYPIESASTGVDKGKLLETIDKNGVGFITGKDEVVLSNENELSRCYDNKKQGCGEFQNNKFDQHYNRYYNKIYIESRIREIKNNIDLAVSKSLNNRERDVRINKSEAIIVDYLPTVLKVFNESRERASVGLFKEGSNSNGRWRSNFCVPFNRKGVVLNFNRYLTEGRVVKISSEFQVSGLGLVSRGYNKEGKLVYGKSIELKPGVPVTFIGGESVRGVVVLSNNKDCSGQNIDIADEFLLEVEIL